jgi:hypothetical protein
MGRMVIKLCVGEGVKRVDTIMENENNAGGKVQRTI